MGNIPALIVVLTMSLLTSCTDRFDVYVDGISMVRSEPMGYTQEIPLTGKVRLDVSSDVDLQRLTEDQGLNLWYEAKTCASKKVIAIWPEIYRNKEIEDNASIGKHHYSVFFDYKHTVPLVESRTYNLMQQPEPLCVRFGAGAMASLRDMKSDTVVVGEKELMHALEINN